MKKFNAKEHIQDLNILRIESDLFTSGELRSKLKEISLPYSEVFFSELRKYNLIEPFGFCTYKFIESPIHYKTLQNIYDSYLKRILNYQRKRRMKENIKNEEIYKAIKLLEDNGFKVYKI